MTNSRKQRVVLDSVIAVSAFLTDGLTADLVSMCQTNVNLYTAEEILQETRRVLLEKPYIRNRYHKNHTNPKNHSSENGIKTRRNDALVRT